ncbi:MAG TPA: FKBP-type peptidyl-prolyl cis-trans isomerase [Saprospiraceae bacterium]|nr:FKBP-type peptidyl-prolyl cis-trans isomerase [Saprospiraceae bacterium]
MKFNTLITALLFFVAVLSVASCKKDDQREIDQQLIEDFIIEHNLDADSTSSGLYYVIDEPGSSEHPTINDAVNVNYLGFLLNGNVFDQGLDVTFPLAQVIPGWQEGFPLFGKGGKGLLIIPSHLGYGDRAFAGIPANSVLVFEIHLLDF